MTVGAGRATRAALRLLAEVGTDQALVAATSVYVKLLETEPRTRRAARLRRQRLDALADAFTNYLRPPPQEERHEPRNRPHSRPRLHAR